MDYYISPTNRQRSEEINIPERLNTQLFSSNSDLIKTIQTAIQPFTFSISNKGNQMQIAGDEVGVLITSRIIEQVTDTENAQSLSDKTLLDKIVSSVIATTLKRDLIFRLKGISYPITPMSLSQVSYLQTLLSPSIQLMIGVGPTGTGKTHLAIAAALNQLAEERIKRIVITKPHVFMEGEVITSAMRQDLEYDSQFEFFEDIFHDLVGYQKFMQLREEKKLDLIPLGHIRGRTFNDSFIILDEAQNMTVRKMRMAVTRIGKASRMVVTGDPVHVDLKEDEPSGLPHLLELLKGTDLAVVNYFENHQVIRNDLVAKLEKLYSGPVNTI